MKIKIFTFALLLAILAAHPAGKVAHAQNPTCVDAAGSPIPCPPTDEPSGGEDDNDNGSGGGAQPGGGNPNPGSPPTATSTPAPTSTPLPFGLPESDFLGSCNSASGNLQDCLDQFTCEDGTLVIKVDIYTGGNGSKYDVYCIPHESIPQLDLPFAIPTSDGSAEDNWGSGCAVEGQEACLDLLAGLCSEDGGDISVWYDDDGFAGVYCENQSDASQPAPTEEAPAISTVPTDDGTTQGDSWDEACTFSSCFGLATWCSLYDGGTGYALEDGNGGYVYHCDIPDDEGKALPGGWLPWGIGFAIVVVMLLPAVQKIREAASRMHQTREHVLLSNHEENGKPRRGGVRVAVGDVNNTDQSSARMLNNKNPELTKNTDEGSFDDSLDVLKSPDKPIKKAKLFVRKQGGDQQDY